jgi:hypothetical protein
LQASAGVPVTEVMAMAPPTTPMTNAQAAKNFLMSCPYVKPRSAVFRTYGDFLLLGVI